MDFQRHSKEYFLKQASCKILPARFYDSLEYSFFSGGKRVRPKCIELVGGSLKLTSKKLFPIAFAVELVHTYSLVHDDLPSMDDDTYRRGKLTHHKKYGEASAVLAGDALLTLAFQVLAESYSGDVLKGLVQELSQCSGVHGMIGGQVLDCLTQDRSLKIFESIHYLKTAKLFEFSFVSPGIVRGLVDTELLELKSIGKNLGLLFQLQDDLFDEDKKDERVEENILSIVSKSELNKMIDTKKKEIEQSFEKLSSLKKKDILIDFVDVVFKRTH